MLMQCCFFVYNRRLLMQHKDDLFEFGPLNERSRTCFQRQASILLDTSILPHSQVVDIIFKHQCIYVISQSSLNVIGVTMSDRDCHVAGYS